MTMNFEDAQAQVAPSGPIPEGTLVFAIAETDGNQYESKNGNKYLKVKYTVSSGPYEGKRINTILMLDGSFRNKNNVEVENFSITRSRIKALLECNGASPNNAAGYQLNDWKELNGKKVALKVSVKDGYNDAKLYLSPIDPGTNRDYNRLVNGDIHPKEQAVARPAPFPKLDIVAKSMDLDDEIPF